MKKRLSLCALHIKYLGFNDNLQPVNSRVKPCLARERVGMLEFSHSALDETTTYKQEKSLVIGWQICHYWSPWVIINVNPNNKYINKYLWYHQGQSFISTNANTQSKGDLPTQQMGSSREAQNPTTPWSGGSGGVLYEFGPFCRRLWCAALYLGITSNVDCSVAQSSVSSWLRKDGGCTIHPYTRRLSSQTSGLWRRTSKGPRHPQLAHSNSLPAAVKIIIKKDNQYCAMDCVWTHHIY